MPVTAFDSVYGKDGNYDPKVVLEKLIHKYFWRNIRNLGFGVFGIFMGFLFSEIKGKLSFEKI